MKKLLVNVNEFYAECVENGQRYVQETITKMRYGQRGSMKSLMVAGVLGVVAIILVFGIYPDAADAVTTAMSGQTGIVATVGPYVPALFLVGFGIAIMFKLFGKK